MSEEPVSLVPGSLLKELGYDEEPEAAASLGLAPKTLVEYRRLGIGPAWAEVGRRIVYSRAARIAWLAAGGTRAKELAD